MKAAKLFLVVIFAMTISLGVKAQDKYEYAFVEYSFKASTKYVISTSIGENYNETEVKADGPMLQNLTPVIAVINKMGNEGWEVYSNTRSNLGIQFYLRKKKS